MPSEIEGLIFPYFFAQNRIFGCLGGILEASWAVLEKNLSRLGPQLGSNLDPKMALELPKSRPRGAYRSPMRPLGAKNRPKAAQNLPNPPPREVPRPPLSLDFGAFWQRFNQKIDHLSKFLEAGFYMKLNFEDSPSFFRLYRVL